MEYTARIYARKILLAHLLVLVLILLVVAIAARQIYSSARQQAIEQAAARQELVGRQTARGIENFYTSIISDMDLLRLADSANPSTLPATDQTAIDLVRERLMLSNLAARLNLGGAGRGPRNPGPGPRPNDAGPPPRRGEAGGPPATLPSVTQQLAQEERQFSPLLWNQLNGRISALFSFDRGQRDARRTVSMREPRPARPGTMTPDELRLQRDVRSVAVAGDAWLRGVQHSSVSRLLPVPKGSALIPDGAEGSVNLVAVPAYENSERLLVAVVPAPQIQTRFLSPSGLQETTSTALVDDSLQVVAATSPELMRAKLRQVQDAGVQNLLEEFPTSTRPLYEALTRPIKIGDSTIEPSLFTIEPVPLPQTNWGLLCVSPIKDVDALLQGIFKTVLIWAVFLVVSMTGVLVSTAFQMIRSRIRLERIQHELLSREVSQARQIQLNWLPDRHGSDSRLDVAAINHPANHISGDFYNWFELPDGRQVVIIGDVTGHGMAAAFLMATTQLLVRTTMTRLGDPGACLTEVNRLLCSQGFNGQFVTMLILVLDLQAGTVEVSTAGHAFPLVSDGTNPFAALPMKAQLVLGVDADQKYPGETFRFSARWSILLYTDGVIDAQAENDGRFGIAGIKHALDRKFASAQEIVDQIVTSVNTFRRTRELGDDLTLVAIQSQPAGSSPALSAAAGERRETMSIVPG